LGTRELTWNENVPIQLAQCRIPAGLAISNAKHKYIFQTEIHGSNFIKQHSETVRVYGLKLAKW